MQSKNSYTFPIVGVVYSGNLKFARELTEGVPLTLVREPDNVHDADAIKVTAEGRPIGYIPNKGVSCSQCWLPIRPKDLCCAKCGSSDYYVKGGLATRLVALGLLDDIICYVSEVDLNSDSNPIIATMLVV